MPQKYTWFALICINMAGLMTIVSLVRAISHREPFLDILPQLSILMLAAAIDLVLIVVLLGKKG